MDKIAKLENSSQHYAWGATHEILSFIDAHAKPGLPLAEVWMGSHEAAPSYIQVGAKLEPLNELIRKDPEFWLGTKVATHYHDMPYLFKVLAAASPLSLQVHPNREQAKEGFAREEKARIPRHEAHRIFKDPHHKPELAVALTPFVAMAGFREPREITELFGDTLTKKLNFKGEYRAEFKQFSKRLFSLSRDAYEEIESNLRTRALELASSGIASYRIAAELVLELQKRFPHDPAQFGPFLFEVLNLEPGEALFIPAGVIHAYVKGCILEIMACSDNVIRAGLTIKHIDVDLLCAILDPNAKPSLIQPTVQRFEWGERSCYLTPAKEFLLERISAHSAPRENGIGFSPEGPEILLCTEGSFMVSAAEMGQDNVESFILRKRESCIVAGSCESLMLEGHGTIWRASIGGVDT